MEKEKIISVMKRYELKYYLNKDQLAFFEEKIASYMKLDQYGLTTIASLYFDTPDFRLITKSIEKPKFKEKIRLRGYGLVNEDKPTFLEVKRKCEGIVYKRRITLSEKEALNFISTCETTKQNQIDREVEAFLKAHYPLEAKYLIIYDRKAFYQDNSDLRITIDRNPRYRTTKLNLHTSMEGIPLVEEGGAILEVKVQNAIPLWLTSILSQGKIYQTSFSKVGRAHLKELSKRRTLQQKEVQLLSMTKKGELEYGFVV